MTRVYVGMAEWYPVPEIRTGYDEMVDIPDDILRDYATALNAFREAERRIINAALAAGDTDWQDYV